MSRTPSKQIDFNAKLDSIAWKGECEYCQHPLQTTLRALFDQPDSGIDYEEGSPGAAIVCPNASCGERYYLTCMCANDAYPTLGKYHKHCRECPGFGMCMPDCRFSHCNVCDDHWVGARCGFGCFRALQDSETRTMLEDSMAEESTDQEHQLDAKEGHESAPQKDEADIADVEESLNDTCAEDQGTVEATQDVVISPANATEGVEEIRIESGVKALSKSSPSRFNLRITHISNSDRQSHENGSAKIKRHPDPGPQLAVSPSTKTWLYFLCSLHQSGKHCQSAGSVASSRRIEIEEG
ncbi:hypothetical protein GUITHDRAFT_107635 [Guillardia theta CCMP2712]|uniref:Uncharacterized protein n=1 Tax=Guillardia theta (strain CCMP2712) TaxID=905079 RepID=L1JD46_GUITC|nr:hypothetical protein GUITHDRAFT_107635 [Guillardia theta CCMP2712]EKX46431.1 hypothetical protein GUITHDRAFT_107635 [Guillardia theta CCMP2712]|eukprot:XP_005833411.1 hypothetical protein GUITHDRAFT_107635 [Guillardia theta CCMP2712]